MKVAVVGAGKMGLPVACQFACNGAEVVACDASPSVVTAINAGDAPIEEPGVEQLLSAAVSAGRLRATTDTTEGVSVSDVIVVLVPALLTPDRDADLSNLLAASAAISRGLRRGAMVCYETTVPVGATRTRLAPELAASGLTPGDDFDVVFSPERVKSRLVLRNLTVNPKVVGGLTANAAERGAHFYQTFLGAPVMNVGTLEAAELVKLAGMLYRDVNIGLANEVARYAEAVGIDLTALLPAINSDGEAALLAPGIGVGGHCTPVYPHFYLRDAERRGVSATVAASARWLNDDQARHAVERLEQSWRPVAGEDVLILGLSFRPGVKEDAFSTTYLLERELCRRGATVTVHDPLFTQAEIERKGLTPASLEGDSLPPVMLLATAHEEYRGFSFSNLADRGVEAVVDGRGLYDADEVRASGLIYIGIGRPDLPVDKTARAAVSS